MHCNDAVLDDDWASSFSRQRQKPIVDLELLRKLDNRIFAGESVLHKLYGIAFGGMMISLMCGEAKQLSKCCVILHHDALGARQG